MPRLNDQFMDVFTDSNGDPKLIPEGYEFARLRDSGQQIDLEFNTWLEPVISIRGVIKVSLLRGGIKLSSERTAFEEGGGHQPGLHMGVEDEYGDRRYLIVDSEQEEVKVSFWDSEADTPDPQDGTPGGEYGAYFTAAEEEAMVVKGMAKTVLDFAKNAIDSALPSS